MAGRPLGRPTKGANGVSNGPVTQDTIDAITAGAIAAVTSALALWAKQRLKRPRGKTSPKRYGMPQKPRGPIEPK